MMGEAFSNQRVWRPSSGEKMIKVHERSRRSVECKQGSEIMRLDRFMASPGAHGVDSGVCIQSRSHVREGST